MERLYLVEREAQKELDDYYIKMQELSCPLASGECSEYCSFIVGGWVEPTTDPENSDRTVYQIIKPQCLVKEALRRYTGNDVAQIGL